MAGKSPDLDIKNFSNLKAVVISASWHPEICQSLIDGAVRGFEKSGISNVGVRKVSGSFELPLAAQLAFDFPPSRPIARIMFTKSTNFPSPIGILRTADCLWKQNKQRPFFGHSYTAPTPSIFTIQQLGLGITKAFTTHIRNATRTNQGTDLQESSPIDAFDSLVR